MLNFDNSVIYKICCNDLEIKDVYVGSTTNFTRRKYEHRTDCRCPKSKRHNTPVYKFIRDNGGIDNWSIIIVERFKAIDKDDLKMKEREWIEKLQTTLNCIKKSYRTKEESIIDDKECQKKYKLKNSFKVECDICGSILSKHYLNYHKKRSKTCMKLQSDCFN